MIANSITEALQLECEARATINAYRNAAICAGCGYALHAEHCARCERRAPKASFVGLKAVEIDNALTALEAA